MSDAKQEQLAQDEVDPKVGVTPQHSLQAWFSLSNSPQRPAPRLPAVGLGVYLSEKGGETVEACLAAFRHGYRHVDTAQIYGNEDSVGRAVRESGLPREQIFVTTKLWNASQGYDKTLAACKESLRRLGLDYVDLYLMHWPVPGLRLESWRAMEQLLAEGKVRSIGVSNFMTQHLEELLANCKIVPAVNQIELSPYCTRKDTVALCKARGIVVEAYSPLTKGEKLADPKLVEIAQKYKVTTAQILLRWALQTGVVILPKSVTDERIRQNIDVFSFHLSREDMELLDSFNCDLATGWDPKNAP